jgi:hypothetical protein
LRFTGALSARGIAVIQREPSKGHSVNNSSVRRIKAVLLSLAGLLGRELADIGVQCSISSTTLAD